MEPSVFEKSLQQGKVGSAYIFLAEDPYWVDRLTDSIRRGLKSKGGEIEEIRFEGNEWTLEKLLSEFNSFSMFSSHRFIRVLEAERIKKAEWERVGDALKGVSEGLTVLFLSHKKDTFKEASKNLAGLSEAVECLKPKGREVPFQVTFFAKEEGKVLNPNDARGLIERTGADLLSLKNQVGLLSIFVGEKRVIDAQDIQKLFADTAEKESFALTRALSDNDRTAAFSLLRTLMEQGEAPVRLLALLSRHFRLLLKAKLLLKKGEGPSGIASALRIPPFVVDQYLMQAQSFSWKKLIEIYQGLFQTDRALKSSPLPSVALLERFIGSALN